MKQLWKRNAVVGTILVFVCAAIFLNGKYAEKVDKPTKVLGQSELVSTDGDAAEVMNRLSTAQPQYLDVVPLTLEEIFIYELGGADYAVKDILL